MKRRNFISLLAPALVFAEQGEYEERLMAGWTVMVSRKLLEKGPATATAAFRLLENKLKKVETAVPEPALKKLRTVNIRVEHPDEGIAKCAAYHHQVLTHTYQPIRKAYKQALNAELYSNVKHAGGKMKRTYDLNNEKEFFAELSEAFFGRNDFYPFVRKEREEYDPTGFEL